MIPCHSWTARRRTEGQRFYPARRAALARHFIKPRGERIVRATDAKEVGVRNPAEENVPSPGPKSTGNRLGENVHVRHRTYSDFGVSQTLTGKYVVSLGSEIEIKLQIEPVRVHGARNGERLVDVISDEKVPVTGLQHRLRRDCIGRHQIDFRADIAAVVWIDSIAVTRSRADAAATRTVDGIRIVAGVVEPEGVVLGEKC